jgi:hypothetical protein
MNCTKQELTLVKPPFVVPAQAPQAPQEHTLAPGVMALAPERLERAKRAYTTRRVPLTEATLLLTGQHSPRPGDLLLARVEKVGQHARIEHPDGRRANLFVGDEIIVCYGHRYAPDQFEAVVPEDLSPCHLVAGGGIAARMRSKHGKMRAPTAIRPLGLLANGFAQRLNLADFALAPTTECATCSARPLTLAVVGSTMNAGKTTTAAHLIRGLRNAGLRVGAAKVTGTGAGGDTWLMKDAGAAPVLDFTDAGLATTYRASLPAIQGAMTTLLGHLCAAWVDALVLEVADGLYQGETAALLGSPYFASAVDGVLFAAADALSAAAGLTWLTARSLPVWAISGALTQSPLASQEAHHATSLPIWDLATLRSPTIAHTLEQLHSPALRAVQVN